MALRILTVSMMMALIGCGGGDAPETATQEPTDAEPAQAEEPPAGSQQDDPNNPWVLGYRWTGGPGMKIKVEWATRDGNYEAIKASGDPRPYGQTEQNHDISLKRNIALATVFVKGLKIRATLEEGVGTLYVEMIRGRLVNPNNPAGDVEVQEVLTKAEVTVEGGPVILAVGEPFDEQPSHW